MAFVQNFRDRRRQMLSRQGQYILCIRMIVTKDFYRLAHPWQDATYLSRPTSWYNGHCVHLLVHFKVVSQDDDCSGEAVAEATKPLEDEALPVWLQPEGGGEAHPFADTLFTLPPGEYRVCATPLTANGEPSQECRPAERLATVFAEMTTEILLIMQCAGDPSGGLDVIAALNDPPRIDRLDIQPSKFITVCESALITVTADDHQPNPIVVLKVGQRCQQCIDTF